MDILLLGHPLYMWATFLSVIVGLLAFDLGFFNKTDKEVSIKGSLVSSAIYVSIGLLFGGFIYLTYDPNFSSVCQPNCHINASSEYWMAFIVEKTLSLDNIFVISLLFAFFGIENKYQHRVLFWGIIGVLFLRGLMIGVGTTLIAEYSWILHIFSGFLIYTGIKMMLVKENDEEVDFENHKVYRVLRYFLPVSDNLIGNKFFTKLYDNDLKKTRWFVTPLFVTLVMVEIVDLIFAVDSIPAVFSVTLDTYIVFTSNIFAILGLRALYFALSAIIQRFEHLKTSLAVVLVFIGAKTYIAMALGMHHLPTLVSLGATFGILSSGILYSLYKTRNTQQINKG